MRHFSEAQGLAPGIPRAAYRDRAGALWFGLSGGLSRYHPVPPRPMRPPSVYMIGLRVAGVPRPISEPGVTDMEIPELPPHQNRLQVDFTSPEGLGGGTLRFQYRMEGVSDDWSPPAMERQVDFANLAPGRYHFLVRAIGATGNASEPPAWLFRTILRASS